ncbi:MAG: GntR family transcriptional regulator [Lachnospiraceae bacterium]|nr:GntR family transcriptional regulator [Lachnospiraceae bacterium]
MITLDVTGRAPIYEQLCRGICGEIAKGLLQPHERIPAARVLAKELGINPNTVAKAYIELERNGIIYSVAGKGCFVADQHDSVYRRLTEEFRRAAREAFHAGVPKEALAAIVEQECGGEAQGSFGRKDAGEGAETPRNTDGGMETEAPELPNENKGVKDDDRDQ